MKIKKKHSREPDWKGIVMHGSRGSLKVPTHLGGQLLPPDPARPSQENLWKYPSSSRLVLLNTCDNTPHLLAWCSWRPPVCTYLHLKALQWQPFTLRPPRPGRWGVAGIHRTPIHFSHTFGRRTKRTLCWHLWIPLFESWNLLLISNVNMNTWHAGRPELVSLLLWPNKE